MVRETRHLWVGNLPENIREDRIREHFKRYGRVQSVKLLPRTPEEKTGEVQMACTVAFMDIKSASKAHNAELKIDDRTLNTKYYEPAAIPSAAAPHPGTPPPYTTSTSPGATRFPNGHGSSDEHGFPDPSSDAPPRFYERPTSGVGAAPTSALEGGSGTCRGGRNRDRFRGGGGPRGAVSVWGTSAAGYADSSRYSNSNERSQSDTTGYSSAPSSDTNDRRNSESVRKKVKSRSGSRSPSPNGSTSTRSPSRSRSRSSSSTSSSSTSRGTSSTSSPRSRQQRHHYKKVTAQNAGASEDRRPLGIRVSNLPVRSSDTSLKDGLFHEYKKHGKVTWVKVVGQNADRHAIVCFKKPEDAEKALEVSYDKLFFGCKIEVEPHSICDIDEVECRYESEIDEYNPKATRTLFIGNLEKDVTASDLRKHFDQFGEIIEIDIKKQGAVSSYAFCQYSDIVSVVKAIRKMDGEHLGNNRIKLGFGKSMPYNCVWIDGVVEAVTEKYLMIQFEPFGAISKCIIDREKGQALVFYEHVSQAQMAVNKMRGFVLKNAKLQVDFASRECQECFFERLEKQGAVLERAGFEDRRDSSSRSFDSTAASRISRYDTPTRPRTSSYSSRSSVAAVASPGTPGNATPRASRARVRYYDYEIDYNAAAALEGPNRHAASHRSYDEYSQGSGASHEDAYDPYDHPVAYLPDNTGHLDSLEVRVVQNLVDGVPYAPDIRNLQKERVHLLEQLEECPSSGDEIISPKKRLKLDLLDPTVGDVIIEANRDHNRKVLEVRRLSESTLRHHTRRPSVDNKYGHYPPHTVGCKRRRTGGSDGGIRTTGTHAHYPENSDGSEQPGSRPGTPLCDENPEFPPGEPPKRTPRERGEGPMMLPLPKWAAQVRALAEFQRGTISVSGIKGQKEHANPLASPPPAATSPRVSQHHAPRPPSPLLHVPPPASPPPRPPSMSSNSSDSDGVTGSPSLEERIKSLDEKYEKWSGSRAFSATGNDPLVSLDANIEKFRSRHKLLEIQDLKEVQPSEIVKSVMAKRSVFDEDLKRLESVGEKYEPKEFGSFCRLPAISTQVTSLTSAVSNANSITPVAVVASSLKLVVVSTQLPKTPTMLSPRSSGTPLPISASRGLQYPFPSHPPMPMSPAPTTSPIVTSFSTTPVTTISTSVTVRNPSLGENRLKSTVNVPGESRTSSVKNRSVASVVSEVLNAGKPKPSEKISLRRNSCSTSPMADVKTRRNSDTSTRRREEAERSKLEEQKLVDKTKEEFEKQRKEQEEKDRLETERMEKEKLERERKEKERLERESELDKQQLQKEIVEIERIQLEALEREREKEHEKERERIRQEKEAQKQRQEKDKLERERVEADISEKEESVRREREERENQEREERDIKEKLERELKESERRDKEEREQKAKEEHRSAKEKERRRSDEQKQVNNRNKDSDNHHERSSKHRENHSELKHRENNTYSTEKQHHENQPSTKESKDVKSIREDSLRKDNANQDLQRRVSYQETLNKHENIKAQFERDAERRKESIKENRDNNIHDRVKYLNNDVTNRNSILETRHMSLDLDLKNQVEANKDPNRRKERNNSLPTHVGIKRRISVQDGLEMPEDAKRRKLSEFKRIAERRDSRDSNKSDDRSKKPKHKNNSMNNYEKHSSSKECEENRKDKDREDKHKHKHKLEKQKSKTRSKEKEGRELLHQSPIEAPANNISMNDKDFLATFNLRSNSEIEQEKQKRDALREKRNKDVMDADKRSEEKKSEDRTKKDKSASLEIKDLLRSPQDDKQRFDKIHKKERIRKLTNSSDSDSDEPKKHSIFDIVDDGPPYISMYDKVKARSCKNMQKQEEEKRQEKIKAKFSQLKLSRARREEKKRSNSWDEDSDTDKETEIKCRRGRKLLDSSDESEDHKSSYKQKDNIYSDSDNSLRHSFRHIKMEQAETTDEEIKIKQPPLRCSKSKITSDSSEEDYQRNLTKTNNKLPSIDLHVSATDTPKASLFGNDTEGELDAKPEKLTSVKTELERLVKKERRNSKFQEFTSPGDHSFNVLYSQSSEVKIDRFNSRSLFDNTSDDDFPELVKDKPEKREKKHKKKQKKQKHSLSNEESGKLEFESESPGAQERKHYDKKKDHSKKDKKRDKLKDSRDKSKKAKKSKSENKSETKRDGKMENIFGSLSEDSEAGIKLQKEEFRPDENAQHPQVYNNDSDKEQLKIEEEKERETEHKKRKEKKRREKERRFKEAAAEAAAAAAEEPPNSNDNSMDFADMCKQLEANIKDDAPEGGTYNTEISSSNLETSDTFNEADKDVKKGKEDRKEIKEKKKKRKKSKDEKRHHHHHHHHEKNKAKTPEVKQEISKSPLRLNLSDIKIEPGVATEKNIPSTPPSNHSQSLPNLDDIQSPTEKFSPKFDKVVVTPSAKPSHCPSLGASKTKRDKLTKIPGFVTEIDELIHENAVKSISGIIKPEVKVEEHLVQTDAKEELLADCSQDKTRVVISQEETEDAVAALLGESFGGCQFEERYDEDIAATTELVVPELVEEPNVQDDEEMRKAVQSLEVEGEISKPDTPQSEHELQIDTDTEEQDESTQVVDQTAKTVESFQNAKKTTAAIPVCSANNKVTSPLAFKPLSSPPSLSLIKSEASNEADKKPKKSDECINVLVEREQQPQQSVISQTWSGERKEVILSKPVLAENPAAKPAITVVEVPPQSQVSQVQTQIKQLVGAPTLKTNEPSYPPLAKLSPLINQKTITTAPSVVQPSTSSVVAIQQTRHNLPARLPDPACKPGPPDAVSSPKVSNSSALSRLPITPVIVTKPLQPATIYLPQPIVAHSSEHTNLISTTELRQERPRMIFHPSGVQPYKAFAPGQPARMLVQGDIRHFPPNAHFVPSRQINPAAYGQYMGLHSPPPFVPLQLLAKQESQIRPEVPESKPVDQHANSNTIKTTAVVTVPHLILTDIRAAPNSLAVKSPPPVASKTIVIPPSSPRRSPSVLGVNNAETLTVSSAASSSPERRSPSVQVAEPPAPVEILPQMDNLHVSAIQNRTSSPSPVIVPNPELIDTVHLALTVKSPAEVSGTHKEQAQAVKPANDLMEVPKEQPPPQLDIAKPRQEVGESTSSPSPAKDGLVDPAVKTEEPPTVPRKIEKDREVQPASLAAQALAQKVTKEEETLEAKEDNEFWSAKDSVNIESVIQTLGSADEMSDSEHNQVATERIVNVKEPTPLEPSEHDDDASVADMKVDEDVENDPADIENDPKTEISVTRSSVRRGRGGRPRANNKVAKPILERGGIQTRRGKQKEAQGAAPVPNAKRGRGGKVRSDRKSSKSESDSTTNDVYEFREDSDDCNKEQRPRLVLTIKSTTSSTSNAQTTTIVKEITKDGAKEIGKEVKDTVQTKVKEKEAAREIQEALHSPPNSEAKDEFTSPQTSNTRKSRRLAEKDVFRNTVDDTIEDVIKNTPLTRAAANQRRSGRQQKKSPTVVQEPELPRKSPRGRKPSRRVSESTENSSSEDLKEENTKPVAAAPVPPAPIVVPTKPKVAIKPVEPIQPEATKEKKVDHCSLKTVMLKRFKGEMNANKPEPTKLIDPVTGMLIPMRESEEGKYIPLPGTLLSDKKPNAAVTSVAGDICLEPKANENAKMQHSVIAQSHPVTVVQQSTPKIHTLKAHVLNSQAAKALVTTDLAPSNKTSVVHNPISKPRDNVLQFASPSSIMGTKCSTPVHIARCGTPVSSSVPPAANIQGGVGPLSPRPGAPVAEVKPQVKAPIHSPTQDLKLVNERHLLQAREHMTEHDVHPMNSHLDFVKQQGKGANKVMSKPVHSSLLQQHMPGQIPNHPVSKALRNEQIHNDKGVIQNSKIDVNLPMMLGRPNLSPSGQQPRLSGGLPVPTYESSLGEPLTHFPALRPNLIQSHYIHPQHMMYQQFLRQQQHFQRTVNLEKPGEDGEDTSVSLALSGRGATVPHHSPHNRATESPAIGQVYNPLTTRLPPYHPGTRFFEPQQPAEPPPAHRPLTSHDRAGLAHIPQLASSDRSLASHGPPHSSSHLISDRPTGIIQARPHSTTHLGAGERSQPSPYGSELSGLVSTNLGASGALMGPAKHMGPDSPVGQRLGNLLTGPAKLIGADAPLSQRIIRMSTPPSPTPASQNLYEALEPYVMKWQGLLALKTDQAAVQMYLISGNEEVAKSSLPKNEDGSTPPLRIFQRMRMEPMQIEGVVRKMQTEKEHCILVALPCGLNTQDVLKQSQNLITLINYLQQKQAAGIINVAYPGTTHPPAYVVHIFPSSDFVNQNLRRLAPTLLDRIVANDTSHLLIVITTV